MGRSPESTHARCRPLRRLLAATLLAAAGAWFALTHIGYPNVALHDGSWVSWERSPMFRK